VRIEFVEFYPFQDWTKMQPRKPLGTVHVYLIEEELDIRGILVFRNGDRYLYVFPHFCAFDIETGKRERYPHLRFTNQAKHDALLGFLKTEVGSIIKKRFEEDSNSKPKSKHAIKRNTKLSVELKVG
jgi:hypothetical protein